MKEPQPVILQIQSVILQFKYVILQIQLIWAVMRFASEISISIFSIKKSILQGIPFVGHIIRQISFTCSHNF